MQKNILYLFLILLINNQLYASNQLEESIIQNNLNFLPPKSLFTPPVADPRWPRFSMGISNDFKGHLGKKNWDFSFGENIGLFNFGKNNRYEFGIQAATFSSMDVGSVPTKLINQDYFIGAGATVESGNNQYLLQIYHKSCHIGDEFMLSESGQNITRINLSFEAVRGSVRHKSRQMFSPYLSVHYLLQVDPKYIKRLMLQMGCDYKSQQMYLSNTTRLIGGVDFFAWQESNYKLSSTAAIGLQFEKTQYSERFLRLLIQYQNGKSRNGQFYNIRINSIGIMLSLSS